MLKRYAARTFLDYTPEDLWTRVTGTAIVVFDDGELEMGWTDIIYSRLVWEFHREFPRTPLLKEHAVTDVLDEERLSSGTHLEILGIVMWAVHTAYEHDASAGLDHLRRRTYQISNQMYNFFVKRCKAYCATVDYMDFVKTVLHPKLDAINCAIEPTMLSMDSAYKQATQLLKKDPDFDDNRIAQAVRSGIAKVGQVLQCVVAAGYRTDMSSMFFQRPITTNYTWGIRTLYDSMIESRSASKALISAKAPLQETEYFSRRLQLVTQNVMNLHKGDCGSDKYLAWKVRDREMVGNQVMRDGDLKRLVGKFYLDEETNTLKVISADDTHLIGKVLKLRSVIAGCAHPDPNGICTTCFGELSLSVPERTNIGHMCCTSFAQKSSQSVLSVKHLDSASAIEAIILSSMDQDFLRAGADDSSFLLSPKIRDEDVYLIIPSDYAPNITDIYVAQDVEDLHLARVSELPNITVRVERQGDNPPRERSVEVNLNRRLASMTYPLLNHIRANGWTVDKKGNYVISMNGWNWTAPILELPLRHFNMSDHSREIARLLESNSKERQKRDKEVNPDHLIIELFDLVNSKLSVNLAVLEVTLYGEMIVSMDDNDYSLPKPWTRRAMGTLEDKMGMGSLSVEMAYEGHRAAFMSPINYTHHNRPDHLMDRLIMPAEVGQYDA